jgi:spermidine synthase
MTQDPSTREAEGLAHDEWQVQNEARIHAHLKQFEEEEEGSLFLDVWSEHFVVVTKSEGHMRLWLMDQGAANTQWVQSDLDLADPLRLVLRYTQAMVLALAWQPDPERVLVTGLGGGCLPLVLHHHLPELHLDCVEIAPPVIRAARETFPLQEDVRLQIVEADVKHFLQAAPPAHYDILFLDLFTDSGNSPAHVTTGEFYQLCQQRLRPDGVLAMNLYSSSKGYPERVQNLRSAFDTVYVCPIHDDLSVVFATNQPPLSRFQLLQRAIEQQRRHSFRFPWVEWIQKLVDGC